MSVIHSLLARRWLVLAALALITAVAGTFAGGVRYDSSIESWLVEDDPGLAAYNAFVDTFSADEIVVVAIFADDVFEPSVLEKIDRITVAAAQLEQVHRVRSIANTGVTRRVGGMDDPAFRAATLASPLLVESLVSKNNDAAAIVVHFSRAGDSSELKHGLVSNLQIVLERETWDAPLSYAMTGGAVLNKIAQEKNKWDVTVLVPVMFVVILGISAAVFRSAALMFLPLTVVAIALVWSFGLMGALGWRMTMISSILFPLILAVGVADAIHVISRYRVQLRHGLTPDEAVRTSFARLLKPCALTTITTVGGLLSLLVSDLAPIREFAVTASAGVISAFVVSITLLPLLLVMLPFADRGRSRAESGILDRFLPSVCRVARRRYKTIAVAALIVTAAFVSMASRVEVAIDPMSWFPEDDVFRTGTERIDRSFGGSIAFEFLLFSPSGRLGDPATLRRLEDFEAWLLQNTGVSRVVSAADMVKEAARIARNTGIGGYELPRSGLVTDMLLDNLQRSGELSDWVNDDYSAGRISARVPLVLASKIVGDVPAIERHIADTFSDTDIRVRMTGRATLTARMQTYVVDSQIESFSVAIVVVSVMMILLLRSPVLGLVAMVANLLPVLIGLGAMDLLGATLNPGTVMIAAVALGIVVDDTVHFMTAFRREMRGRADVGHAVDSAILEVGRPVSITSGLLAVGFAVLIFGSFLPSRQIGAVVSLIVVAALLAELFLLPAILRLLPPGFIAESANAGMSDNFRNRRNSGTNL